MSNDQSPPARKVIPYKKGGPRKSPFADMAFQFSGTALDVAIQQREEGAVESPPEISETTPRDTSEEKHETVSPPVPEVEPAQEIKAEKSEPPRLADAAAEQDSLPSAPADTRPQPRPRRATSGGVRLVTDKSAKLAASEVPDGQLQAFLTRWKPFLTETQLGICTYVYNNSVPSGQEEYCFTSTAKLMAAVSKTERQVKTVLNQLTEWGFLVKGETVVNAPREQRGTYYKLVVTKS